MPKIRTFLVFLFYVSYNGAYFYVSLGLESPATSPSQLNDTLFKKVFPSTSILYLGAQRQLLSGIQVCCLILAYSNEEGNHYEKE